MIHIWKQRHIAQMAVYDFFHSRDYLSLDTPIGVISPGTEVHLQYFQTEWKNHQNKSIPLYLRSSPELHLKQALGFGVERVFHLGKCFRNKGELSDWHHPEFTMLEFYQTHISFFDFMSLTEDLIQHVAQALSFSGTKDVVFPKKPLRLSMFEAFEDFTNIVLIDQDPDLAKKGIQKGFPSLNQKDDFETAYFKILLDIIEPKLKELESVFIYDYPASQCALSKIVNGRAQRFELYLNGVELCNAFDELLDPKLNRLRIVESNKKRKQLGYKEIKEDEDFFQALEKPIGSCQGNALGFDRLLALLLGEKNIHRVIPFRWNQPWRG